MSDIPLGNVLRLEHEPKGSPLEYTPPPEYTVEAAPPAYTRIPNANDTSAASHDGERAHGFRRDELEPQFSPSDKRPAWRRAITRRFCGVPRWMLLILVPLGIVIGAVVGIRSNKAKVDLFRSDYWYTFDAIETYTRQSHLYADIDLTNNKVRLLADEQMQNGPTARQWQIRKLVKYDIYEESCKEGVGKNGITLYWIKNHFTGPSARLGFKERFSTQRQVKDSGKETLELELSDDPTNEPSQMWYAEQKDDEYNREGTPIRLWNCVTKEDFVLGWQNTTSETGSKVVVPMMVFAADRSKHMLWNIRDLGESYKIKPGDGWQVD